MGDDRNFWLTKQKNQLDFFGHGELKPIVSAADLMS